MGDVVAERFDIRVEEEAISDLKVRLARTRFPDEVHSSDWNYGSNLAYMRELVGYWQERFDWRKQEQQLNKLAHFRTNIDGLKIHFVQERGKGPDPFPLVLTHGWPSSFLEMLKVLPRLTDPASFGGDSKDSFDIVIPSLPGFGFSSRPTRPEQGSDTSIADTWDKLMSEVLGYSRYGAHGGDVGGGVTVQLGRLHSEHVVGLHVNGVSIRPNLAANAPPLSDEEKAFYAEQERWDSVEGAYILLQHTKPQTLAYGLNDSPTGLAAWIVEKFRAWSDCNGDVESRFTKDELLTNVSLYWFTQTINSSFGPYYVDDDRAVLRKGERIEVPCAVSLFPKNMDQPPRELAERVYNLQRWTVMPRGGHFPAMEEPELLANDIREFFRPLR